jgi:hypothetical protein
MKNWSRFRHDGSRCVCLYIATLTEFSARTRPTAEALLYGGFTLHTIIIFITHVEENTNENRKPKHHRNVYFYSVIDLKN